MLLGARQFFQTRKKLPYDAEVEYLESTGTQWIDTGYSFNSATDKVELVFELLNTTPYKWIFGAYDTKRFAIGSGDGTNRRTFAYNASTSYISDSYYVNGAHTLVADSSGAGIDGSVLTAFVDFSTTSHIFLYSIPIDTSTYCSNSRIWSYKHYRNGVLVRDFIPVRVGGVGCMYDRVSRRLFGNQGTGNFVVGPDVVEVEYLESTGTQYIDTGVVPKSTVGAKIQFELTNPKSDRAILMDGGDAAGFRWGFSSIYTYTIQVSGINATGATWNNYSLPTGTNEVKYNYTNDKCCYLNGTLIRDNIPYGDIARTSTIWLNASYNDGVSSPWRVNSMKVYSLQMTDNGVIVRNMVPVRVGMEGAMMDKLTRKIYRNAGTGAFKIGADKKNTPLMCNSYVKDGLVAMWDGIENAGWGVHDANATTWKDLIRGTDCDFFGTTGNPIWTDNAWSSPSYLLTNSGAFHATFPDASADGSCTFEFVALKSYNSRGSVMSYFSVPDASASLAVEWQTAPNNRARFYYAGNPDTASTTDSFPLNTRKYFAGVCSKKRTYKIYGANAEVLYNTTFGADKLSMAASLAYIGNDGRNDKGWYGEINSIRIYNRALTAEEIAHNYEVDKKRFNLS